MDRDARRKRNEEIRQANRAKAEANALRVRQPMTTRVMSPNGPSEVKPMATTASLQAVAQLWCRPETEHIVMEPALAEAFAEMLNKVALTARDLALLEEVYELLDDWGDGAPDSSHAAHKALNLSEPLGRLIKRVKRAADQT